MFSSQRVRTCAAVVGAFAVGATTCGAELPTVKDVLDAHAANEAKLTKLHLQVTQTEEYTEAFRKSQAKQAGMLESLAKLLESGEKVPEIEKNGTSPEILRKQAETNRLLSKNENFENRYEFFINGNDYQVRSLLMSHEKDAFPSTAVTPASLIHEFAFVRVYSRFSRQTPAARVWPGHPSPGATDYALLTAKEVGDIETIQFPPFTSCTKPRWDKQHPIDTFFAAKPDLYRIVGEETKNGRKLTIVEVSVPTDQQTGIVRKDGKTRFEKLELWFRGWLDLQHGAMPVTLEFWYGVGGQPFEHSQRSQPAIVTTATDIRRLPNGAYYPATSVSEHFGNDPSEKNLTPAEYEEAFAGKRPMPKLAVHGRRTWKCTTVDDQVPGGDFFVLQFPKGQAFYDYDTQKVIGGLEAQPSIKRGQMAPALKVARWLDGKEHSLADYRGKVVVIDFWGLWCGACRYAVPGMVALQEKYKDKPVVFLSVHTADRDADEVAKGIEKFAKEQKWKFLAGVDQGTMSENSVTCKAYGVTGYPTTVVIGRDGIVTYNSDVPPPGMEGIFGKTDEELTPEDNKKAEAFMKTYTEEAGEKWPPPKNPSTKEIEEMEARVNVFHFSREIDAALAGKAAR
jgi:thiol-disulfide isomerase/thioredoxin